jgi:hypothetical protein
MVKVVFLWFLFLPVTLAAQSKTSIQLAPYSIKFWGQMPSTFTIQAQHRCVMVGYYHIRNQYFDEFQSPTKSHTLGLFYKPDIQFGKKFEASPILGLFNHRFPTKNAAWWAFGLNINYKINEHFGVYYQHISNGWLAPLNPGLDNIGLKYIF